MKATIRTERVYDITVGGVTKSGWREVSSWNGMVELERHNRKIIALSNRPGVEGVFEQVLGLPSTDDLTVIKASPDLHDWLKGGSQ